MDNTHRFSNRVDNYVKYRPGYPSAVLDLLTQVTGFSPAWKVADIGSGTGISTALFLGNGNTVYAVEPNDAMREKAEELPGNDPGFISINGTAEHTGLAASSVDLVIAGQAFHWFEPVAPRKEFGTDYAQVNHSNVTLKEIESFFRPMPFQLKVTGNRQTFDWERLKGRLLSSSYIPIEENDIYKKMIEQLRQIFVSWQKDGVVHFDYQTKLYIARN